jgi:murein L,D-transpeptidase YafK
MQRLTAKLAILLLLVPCLSLAKEMPRADKVLVDKSDKRLYLIKEGRPFRQYRIVLGKNPSGHKRKVGDERTPEGRYTLDWRNPESNFYKSIHISYPDERDLAAARARGEDPGGMIMIHGLPNNFKWGEQALDGWDWTDGCIAVRNHEMDEIWLAVEDGTPIEIIP